MDITGTIVLLVYSTGTVATVPKVFFFFSIIGLCFFFFEIFMYTTENKYFEKVLQHLSQYFHNC